MPGLHAREIAMLAACGVLVTVTVVWVLFAAARGSLCSCVRQVCASMAHAVRTWKRAADDEVAVEAQKRDRNQKVLHMRRVCMVLALLALPINLNVMFRCGTGRARPNTIAHDVIMTVMHSTLAATLVFPRMLSWMTIDVIYCALVSCAALFVAPPPIADPSSDHLVTHLISFNMLVACLGVARRDVYVVAPMNLVFTLSSGVCIMSQLGERVEAPGIMVFSHVMVMGLVTGCACILDSTWRMLIYEGLSIKATKQLLSAATALLKSCCDVVVEVDSEGVITVPARDLGSFLLRGVGYCLHGYRLTDLMVDEEDGSPDADGRQTIHFLFYDISRRGAKSPSHQRLRRFRSAPPSLMRL